MNSFAAVVVTMLSIVGVAFTADTAINWKDLPPVVQAAMLKEARGAKIKNTLIEMEDGKKFYECETVRSGKTRDFLVDPQGNVTEVEDQVELGQIPKAVKAAVEKAAADGGKVTKLEVVTSHGKIAGYEATIVKNGKRVGLELNPDGSRAK